MWLWDCLWERRLQAGPGKSKSLGSVRSRQDGGAQISDLY
jgi:hypothetical protein